MQLLCYYLVAGGLWAGPTQISGMGNESLVVLADGKVTVSKGLPPAGALSVATFGASPEYISVKITDLTGENISSTGMLMLPPGKTHADMIAGVSIGTTLERSGVARKGLLSISCLRKE